MSPASCITKLCLQLMKHSRNTWNPNEAIPRQNTDKPEGLLDQNNRYNINLISSCRKNNTVQTPFVYISRSILFIGKSKTQNILYVQTNRLCQKVPEIIWMLKPSVMLEKNVLSWDKYFLTIKYLYHFWWTHQNQTEIF